MYNIETIFQWLSYALAFFLAIFCLYLTWLADRRIRAVRRHVWLGRSTSDQALLERVSESVLEKARAEWVRFGAISKDVRREITADKGPDGYLLLSFFERLEQTVQYSIHGLK